MAEALLKGWNAPAVVSSVAIDGQDARVESADNAAVTDLARDGGVLRWNELDNALPLPLLQDNATTAMLLELTDIEQALNQEPLRVTGLEPGKYSLTIDGQDIGQFSEPQLEAGINLADYNTPMRFQAQQVSWIVRDLVESHYIHLRMRVRRADTGAEEGADRMQAFEDSLEDTIYAQAAPVPHKFELRQTETPTAQGAE